MLTPLPVYRPFGEPAKALVTVNTSIIGGDKITVNGDDFIAGTNFGFVGRQQSEIAEALASAINGGVNPWQFPTAQTIVRPYWAYADGPYVFLIATSPGTGGNALTLTATGNGFSVSGSTFAGGTAKDSGGGGGVTIAYPTVTRHSIVIGASATQAIPAGAKGYSFTVFTGTASDGTASGLPAGFSHSDPNTLATGFTITTSAASSAFVSWNT